tara:strand:+ start:96 stop:545 length:450 start_codon:yes stop_codon:yes gene_type:complete
MNKNLLIIILLLLLPGCGYESIYVKNYKNFSIKNFSIEEPSRINNRIKRALIKYSKSSGEIISIDLKSKKNKIITAKDNRGYPLTFQMSLQVDIMITKNKENSKKTFLSNFSYNNRDNQFDLKQYENDVEAVLIDKTIQNILLFITSNK